MFLNNFFTISDFAKLMGISRQTLIYYDRIGLFKPVKVLNNQYRLYSRSQINVISLISMLSEMGVPLKEIKMIVDDISPDKAIEILNKQQNEVNEKLRKLKLLDEMISMRIEQITQGKEISNKKTPSFSITQIDEDVPLFLGDEINCPYQDIDDEFIIDFYAKCEKNNFPLMFSSGQMKSKENILNNKPEIITNLFFFLKNAEGANGIMPKGTYAIGYVNGDYGETDAIYRDLLLYIENKGFRVVGNSYEIYLLDELAEANPDHFIIKIMIQIA